VDKLPFALKDKPIAEIDQIEGIGKGLASKIIELLETGSLTELNEMISKTPEGVVEMLSIKGIGPKKISIIWHTLGIESIGELYYACNENRLIEAKGFGLKTQEEIKKAIEFKLAANGRFLYAQIEPFALELSTALTKWMNHAEKEVLIEFAGQYRRSCEIIDELEIILGVHDLEKAKAHLLQFTSIALIEAEKAFLASTESGLHIKIYLSQKSSFQKDWFRYTGNEAHAEKVLELAGVGPFESEQDIYAAAGMQYVAAELREDHGEIEQSKTSSLPQLIEYKDLKGSLHNHSTWSDGVHSLEEMALYCKDILNLEYLGICDHSKTAVYAKGLNEQRVFGQHQEIDALNLKLAPFKIFKGIESDILSDGSLDYYYDVLKTFDFVVASIHSNLRMDEDKATSRLLKAIENPYTTILGHPTGRLLLSRAGYPIDYKKVIDACAANGVVIEINANPLRLDLDWRWHKYALEKGVLLSINPDAHRTEGFHDMKYGILVARKGGLSADKCLNAFSLDEISSYFNSRKSAV